jgi:hypothetical protein
MTAGDRDRVAWESTRYSCGTVVMELVPPLGESAGEGTGSASTDIIALRWPAL